MNRDLALSFVKSKVKNANLVKHMLAAEAIMRKLAKHFGQDEEKWGLAGLLHDLDYSETINNFSQHGILAAEMLKEMQLDEEIINAIMAHPGHKERKSLMDKALYATDPITGLIVACALIHPDKKLANITLDFVKNRFNEKRFAAGANREQIKSCAEMGISLDEFISLSLSAMQEIADELGL